MKTPLQCKWRNTLFGCFQVFREAYVLSLGRDGRYLYEPIADFAIGISDNNYVLLCVDADVAYRRLQENGAIHSYAAHGGLIV